MERDTEQQLIVFLACALATRSRLYYYSVI